MKNATVEIPDEYPDDIRVEQERVQQLVAGRGFRHRDHRGGVAGTSRRRTSIVARKLVAYLRLWCRMARLRMPRYHCVHNRQRAARNEEPHDHDRQRRRASRPAARQLLSLSHLLAHRRRHVLRRHRHLPRQQRARCDDTEQILDAGPEHPVHLAHARRHDDRRVGHRLPGRPVRPALHLPVQSPRLRARLARGGVRAGHEPAHRLPLRAGDRFRRRDRGRLFDADRVRAAEDPRALARLHVVPGRRGLSGDRAARLPDHPDFRLAADVRRCGGRRARRLVPAQAPARVPALARSEGPGGRGRGADACDREGSGRRRGTPTTSGPRRHRAGHRRWRCSGRRSCNAWSSEAGC